MKKIHWVLLLTFVLSLPNTQIVKADIIVPQGGHNSAAKCPQGYVRINGQCTRAGSNFADPNQSNTNTEDERITMNEDSDSVFKGIVNVIWFYFFGYFG